MKICGIAAEYNPFHTGHKYHIDSSRKLTSADGIIAVMSGPFVQRGAPAVLDKFTRAKIAVCGGADLVIELPFCFACGCAQYFAEGAVNLLSRCGTVDFMSFGSESGILPDCNSMSFSKHLLKESLEKGMSYPAAYAASADAPNSAPNDILAAEYVKAISKFASPIKPIAVKRMDSGYHSTTADKYASATSIRHMIETGCINKALAYLPSSDIVLEKYNNESYADFSELNSFVLGMLRSGVPNLKDIAYVSEGLENRFISVSKSVTSVSELLSGVKTKRYTYSRLSRIVCCMLVGLTKEKLDEFVKSGPGYIRVLSSNSTGKQILAQIKKKSQIPVITNVGSYKKLDKTAKEMFVTDIIANDIFSLAIKKPALRAGMQDFKKLSVFSD